MSSGGLDFGVTSASTGIGERPGTRTRRPSSSEPQLPAGLSPGVREYLRCTLSGRGSYNEIRRCEVRMQQEETLAYLTEKSSTLSPRHLNERKTSDGESQRREEKERDGGT
ncbi:unnamed protein product [Lasius platythorax]|uniref:Uncharacterized protein n=1 Tax=Lasius platythorax TaxID=488582 RepID=A0AAV2NJ64_9HYME